MKPNLILLTALPLAPLTAIATEQVHHKPGALSRIVLPTK